MKPLTRSFKATVRARATRDAAFRQALLREARQALRSGDVRTARALRFDTTPGTP